MVRVRFLHGPSTLSTRAQKAFQLAHQEAHRLNHASVGTEHLLLGLAKDTVSPAGKLLGQAGFNLPWLRQQVALRYPAGDGAAPLPASLPYSEELVEFLDSTVDAGYRAGILPLSPELLLLALAQSGGGVGEVFEAHCGRLLRLLRWLRDQV